MTSESLKTAGLPRRRRKADRPGEIIAAGLAEFGAHGFGAARMEDVARRAGVAKGTVFRYFPTKEALFEAALVFGATLLFDGARPIPADGGGDGPAMALMARLLDRFYDAVALPELRALMRVIIAEGARFPAILASYHRVVVAPGVSILTQLVSRGVATGEFRSGAVAELPMILFSPTLMAAVWQMTFNALEPIGLDRFKAAHLEVAARVLLPADGPAPAPAATGPGGRDAPRG